MRNIEDEILRKKLHDCGHFMCTYHKTYLVQNSLEKEKFMLDKIVQQNVLIFAIYLLKYEKKHVGSFDGLLCQKLAKFEAICEKISSSIK